MLRDHVAGLRLDNQQARATAHILACRTGRLGGHLAVCDRCGHTHFAYHSCRDRHCPRCGSLDQALWAEAQLPHLLPLSYFHLVFTLPAEIAPIAYQNKAVVYDLLFRAAAETLTTIAADPRHLGARIGFTAVLHTWGSAMTHRIST